MYMVYKGSYRACIEHLFARALAHCKEHVEGIRY